MWVARLRSEKNIEPEPYYGDFRRTIPPDVVPTVPGVILSRLITSGAIGCFQLAPMCHTQLSFSCNACLVWPLEASRGPNEPRSAQMSIFGMFPE